jgi:hypothetical protein
MKSPLSQLHDRRAFLGFLAGSPYVAAPGGIRAFAQRAPELADVISDPKATLSVMDFEGPGNAESRTARPVAFEATWELRFGPENRFRVFYAISHERR